MSNVPKLSIKERLAASAARKGARPSTEIPKPPVVATAPAQSSRPSESDGVTIDIELTSVPPGVIDSEVATDIEIGFDAIERKTNRSPPMQGKANVDLTEVRTLFAEIAESHMRQVSDFMIELRWGSATVEWIRICDPAVQSLRRAAENLEFGELCSALDGFTETLRAAERAGTIEAEHKSAIVERHAELVRIMPQAFAVDESKSAREGVIIQALLAQLPDVKKVTIDRLYAAGLTTLEAFFLTTAEDIVATTGIDPEVACEIVEHFLAYKKQLRAAKPSEDEARETTRLERLSSRLRKEVCAHDEAAAQWSADAQERKKELRQARMRTVLELQIVLARIGEMDLVRELERVSFEQKLAALERYLKEAHAAKIERSV